MSNNTLSDLEKAFLIQKWNDEAQTKTQLDSQASTYSVSATAYDNAVAALSSGLIAAGAPSNWASTWPDGTTFTSIGIVAALAGWWSTIASTRTALQGAINAKILANASTDATNKANAAQSAAISAAATDAATKALDAILKSQLHQVAWASSALPTLPSGTYPAGYLAQTTDNRKFQVNASGTAWGEITQAAIGIFGQILAAQLTVANFDNLVPNPGSEMGSSAAGMNPEGNWIGQDAVNAFSGSWVRYAYSSTTKQTNVTIPIPCAPGDSFYFEAMTKAIGGNGTTVALFTFMDASLSPLLSCIGNAVFSGSAYQKSSVAGTAPSGAAYVQASIKVNANGSPSDCYFDALYFRRMADANLIVDGAITAQKLAAVLAIVGTIKDPYYVAGSTGNAPTGFKLSGTPFTTTFIDGTTDANCHLELEGSANFGGQKVATIVNKVIGNVNTRTTAGTMDITIPAGITRVTLEGFGGCGGGGGASSGQGGGGGAAGDGRRQPVTVVPGTTYRITVGAGGTAGAIGGTGGAGGATTMAYLSGPDSGFTTISFSGGLGGTSTGIGGATGLGSPGGVAATGSVVATSGVIQPAAVQSFSGVWSVPGGGGGGGGVVGVSGSNPAPGGGANGVGGGPINLTSTSGRAGGGGGGYAGNGQYGGQGGTWTVSGSIATAGTAGAPGSATLSW